MNWPALMELGLGRLRLSPATFWSMTPRELTAALNGAGLSQTHPQPMTRSDFTALTARFPDSDHHDP